jgi:hypothetical protein
MPGWSAFELVRDKAWDALQMLRDAVEQNQADYFKTLGRYWEGPTNPVELPIDGESEEFEPNLSLDGCPSWREMGFKPMAVPFSLHCDRVQEFHRNYACYILGVSFLWTGLHEADNDRIALVSRLLRYDGAEWADTGWCEYPAGMDSNGDLMFSEGIPIEMSGKRGAP